MTKKQKRQKSLLEIHLNEIVKEAMVRASVFTAIACILILTSTFFFNYYIGAIIVACTIAGCTYGYKMQGHIDYKANVLKLEERLQASRNIDDEFYLAS